MQTENSIMHSRSSHINFTNNVFSFFHWEVAYNQPVIGTLVPINISWRISQYTLHTVWLSVVLHGFSFESFMADHSDIFESLVPYARCLKNYDSSTTPVHLEGLEGIFGQHKNISLHHLSCSVYWSNTKEKLLGWWLLLVWTALIKVVSVLPS